MLLNQFPPDLQRRIEAQIASGEFATEEEVLRQALDTLEKRQRGLGELRGKIHEAEEDIAAGRVAAFDVEATKQAVREQLRQHGIHDG